MKHSDAFFTFQIMFSPDIGISFLGDQIEPTVPSSIFISSPSLPFLVMFPSCLPFYCLYGVQPEQVISHDKLWAVQPCSCITGIWSSPFQHTPIFAKEENRGSETLGSCCGHIDKWPELEFGWSLSWLQGETDLRRGGLVGWDSPEKVAEAWRHSCLKTIVFFLLFESSVSPWKRKKKARKGLTRWLL